MNKKHVLLMAFAAMACMMSSCLKSGSDVQNNCTGFDTGVPSAAEISTLQSYITSNGISATQHPDGFFYKIVSQGGGAFPLQSSTVTVKYTGKLTNGNIFDQNLNGTSFVLSNLILGWRKGLPLIQKGGSIILYLPPSLGYGCANLGSVPPGSYLIFSIDLLDVQ